MRYILLPFIALTIFLSATPSSAHRGEAWNGKVVVEIVSDSGSRFHTIPHRDFRRGGTKIIKRYLEAWSGENYSIVIRNNTPERIGLVIAVDGRNIISGKKSRLKNNESMYIINGYGHSKLDGWRTDNSTVHRFYFTDPNDSYTKRTFNDTSAMGVIAVAVFREKDKPTPLFENRERKNTPAAPSEAAPRSKSGQSGDDTAGTGFGDGKYSLVVKVQFEPESMPAQKTLIKYEWREVLCTKGILKCRPKPGNRLWGEDDFAPYPPGYPNN